MDPLDLKNIEFSPQMRLLLWCCEKTTNEKHQTNITKIIHEGLKWDKFMQLVNYHQVLPIVYHNLQKHAADKIPPHTLGRLKNRGKKQKLHSMRLTAELIRIVKLCREQGIEVICLKGPVLSLQLYRDIALRHIIDIDLLVKQGDIEKVHHLLVDSGYVAIHPELFSSTLHWRVFKKSKHHIPYHHKKKSIHLEIHFRLFKNFHVFPNRELNAWNNPQSFVYAGVKLNTLAAIDNILFLFVHASIHKWHLLKWLTDMARLCHSQPIDWEKLLRRAVEVGLERPVLQGMLLLNYLFAVPLPGIFSQFPVSKPVIKLTHHALMVIKESRESEKYGLFFAFRERFYLLKLKKGMKYKLRYLRDLFYLDSHRGLLRLPWFLFPLYLVLNPFLWFYKNYIKDKMYKKSEIRISKFETNKNDQNSK
jgi:hypothetical protein